MSVLASSLCVFAFLISWRADRLAAPAQHWLLKCFGLQKQVHSIFAHAVSVMVGFGTEMGILIGPLAAAILVMHALVGVGTGVKVGIGALAFAGVASGLVARAVIGGRTLFMTRAGTGGEVLALATIVTTSGVGAVAISGSDTNPLSILVLLLFWVYLPILNGILDWISLSVSRWFGRGIIAESRSGFTLAWTALLALADLIAAVAFLFTITWLLTFGIEALGIFAGQPLELIHMVPVLS